MIAMQYSILLPADYDMAAIDRRIAEKGGLTDGFPGLRFKAYLSARPTGAAPEADKLYAPFYLWESADGMNEFLCGPGFAALTRSFGRPAVQTWSVWAAEVSGEPGLASHATREVLPIPRHADLVALRAAESARVRAASSECGPLATVAGFDPGSWNLVRFCLWSVPPEQPPGSDIQAYAVGHVSTGNASA